MLKNTCWYYFEIDPIFIIRLVCDVASDNLIFHTSWLLIHTQQKYESLWNALISGITHFKMIISAMAFKYSPIYFLKNFRKSLYENHILLVSYPPLSEKICMMTMFECGLNRREVFAISCVFISDFLMVSYCPLIWFDDGVIWWCHVASALFSHVVLLF